MDCRSLQILPGEQMNEWQREEFSVGSTKDPHMAQHLPKRFPRIVFSFLFLSFLLLSSLPDGATEIPQATGRYWASLSLSFPVCKMGVVRPPFLFVHSPLVN